MTLILADRVDSIEGIISDLKEGTIPNIFKERGWTAEWKYNRPGFLKSAAITVLVGVAALTLLNSNTKK